jgi:hypothetical protein
VRYLDAPVSGGRPGAVARTLTTIKRRGTLEEKRRNGRRIVLTLSMNVQRRSRRH